MITNVSFLTRDPPRGWKWALVDWYDQGTYPALVKGSKAFAILNEYCWGLAVDLNQDTDNAWNYVTYENDRKIHVLTRLTRILYFHG